jgi:uncharacterized lipoprotein YbaY
VTRCRASGACWPRAARDARRSPSRRDREDVRAPPRSDTVKQTMHRSEVEPIRRPRASARAALAAALLALSGCAAMKRTWVFRATPVVGERVDVTPNRLEVAQKSAYVSFWVRNRSAAPVVVEAGSFTMRLPDGTAVAGKTNFLNRHVDTAWNVLARTGLVAEKGKPALPPGASVEVALQFRQYGRDLRRQTSLSVALDGLRVDGQPVALPPLVLAPPPEAPTGEDI